jgi:hypothetical protein
LHETIKFYGTLRAFGKISVKNTKRFDKNIAFFVDIAVFFRTIDGLLRYGTVR